jgi:hypothetical protein
LRISAKDIPSPFLLASAPLSDRIPGCTRTVARYSSTSYCSVSPGLTRKALRTFSGIVNLRSLATGECSTILSILPNRSL